MALIRWEPTRELTSLQHEVNRLFNSFFDTPEEAANSGRRWVPSMDLVETDDAFVLHADLPGLTEEDVNIEVEDRVMTISGERESKHETTKGGYYRVERAFGSFARTLTLPEGVDPSAIGAHFDKGVLEVRIPKPEERKARRVSINVGGGEPKTIEGSGTEAKS